MVPSFWHKVINLLICSTSLSQSRSSTFNYLSYNFPIKYDTNFTISLFLITNCNQEIYLKSSKAYIQLHVPTGFAGCGPLVQIYTRSPTLVSFLFLTFSTPFSIYLTRPQPVQSIFPYNLIPIYIFHFVSAIFVLCFHALINFLSLVVNCFWN